MSDDLAPTRNGAMSIDQRIIENTAEACADALLTACTAVLRIRDNNLTEFEVPDVVTIVGEMLDRVLSRTEYEGGKPE